MEEAMTSFSWGPKGEWGPTTCRGVSLLLSMGRPFLAGLLGLPAGIGGTAPFETPVPKVACGATGPSEVFEDTI